MARTSLPPGGKTSARPYFYPTYPSLTAFRQPICAHSEIRCFSERLYPYLVGFGTALAKCERDLFNLVVSQQQTLHQSVSYSGVGLHGGSRVNMSFHPAAPNRGIRFRRLD